MGRWGKCGYWLHLVSLLALTIGWSPIAVRAQDQITVYDSATVGGRGALIPEALHGVTYQITSASAFDATAAGQAQAQIPTELCARLLNAVECGRAHEQYFLTPGATGIIRTGDTLTIPLKPPYALVMADKRGIGGGGWAVYSYIEYLPTLGQHHVAVVYYEGGDDILIDAQTGETTVIPYAPVLSPDHKRFVVAGSKFEGPFTIQIWQAQGTRLNLEVALTLANLPSYPRAKQVQWLDPTTIQFDIQPLSDQPPTLLKVKQTNNGWKVYYDEKELITPPLHAQAVADDNLAVYGVESLQVGKRVYRDREYRFKSVPADLAGQQYLLFANNATRNTEADYIHFTLARPATVYIAIDDQALHLPGWMDGWQPTPDFLLTDDPINLRLYKKEFGAGRVTLGGNWAAQAAGIRSHYLVVVAPMSE